MVTSDREAARLRLEWDHLLAKPSTPADLAADIRDAMPELDDRWPGAHEESLIATEEELGGLGRELRAHRQGRRRASGVNASEAARRRRQRGGHKPASPKSTPARRPASTPARRRPASSRTARRVADVTGATQLANTTADYAIGALRVALGLALVYLLLSPKGSRGLAGVLNGVASMTTLLLAPVDPLNPPKPTPAATNANGVPILLKGETKAHYDQRMFDYLRMHPAGNVKPVAGAGIFGADLGGLPTTVNGPRRPSAVPHPNTP